MPTWVTTMKVSSAGFLASSLSSSRSSCCSETSGSRRLRRRSTGVPFRRSIVCSLSDAARTSSTTLICGMAKRSPAHSTIRAETMASVSGILMTKVDPLPWADLISIVPPIFSMLVFTTSMPTPRPDTLVTLAAVEKPGFMMNWMICWSVIEASSISDAIPFWIAFCLIRSMARPLPSSWISMMMWPPS